MERASTPSPPSRGSGESCELPNSGFRSEPRPPKVFPLFSALRTASSDTIVNTIVDYYAATERQDPMPPPLLRTSPAIQPLDVTAYLLRAAALWQAKHINRSA